MAFKEEFFASQEKAYLRNIGTKIYDEMTKLRASVDSSSTSPRRWVWELLQNAKDARSGDSVSVAIEFEGEGTNPHLTFKHSGAAFSAENIRFLIEQVSSKDRTPDQTGRPATTGKFGTGFLTTHLLAEKVVVTGIVDGRDFGPKQFRVVLDRSGEELRDIIEAVKEAQDSLANLDSEPNCVGYAPGKLNTAFRFPLEDDTGKRVAKAGLKDLATCIPYVLAFVPEIGGIKSPGCRIKIQTPINQEVEDEVQILSVTADCVDNENQHERHTVAVLRRGLTQIAVPIREHDETVRILAISEDVPRLFCDFPLLGTENFPFPVITNNPTFNPTEPRDGVFLTPSTRALQQIEHNKFIIREALELYLLLLSHASANGWRDIHLLGSIKLSPTELQKLDEDWFKTEILRPMRDALQKVSIVRNANGRMVPITDVWFPSNPSKKVRTAIWQCCKAWIPHNLPTESDVEAWFEIMWVGCDKLTLDQVALLIEETQSLEKLAEELTTVEAHDWLQSYYATLALDETSYQTVLSKRRIFPNQNGIFKRKAELSRDAGNIDPLLLEVLKLLGNDLRDQLLDGQIDTELEDLPTKDGAFVVKEINAIVERSINNRDSIKRNRSALDRLLIWFHENKSKAKKLFPMLYDQRILLYDDDEIHSNMELVEELDELFTDFAVTSIAELRTVIATHSQTSQLLPVTQQIVASLGITSIEQWVEALKDKDLAALFAHESTPTTDMFIFAQSLIAEAKIRVIGFLSKLKEYDLSDMDETAPTILAGIRKNGRDVTVVVRPAYDGTVIIYYQSERDVLDFEECELWVDAGQEVRQITFGHILKKAGIRRFPI